MHRALVLNIYRIIGDRLEEKMEGVPIVSNEGTGVEVKRK